MVLRRISLFTFGLIYGAIINTAVLGIAYALYSVGVAFAWIFEQENNCRYSRSRAEGFILILSAIAVVAACIGIVYGIGYGLIMGTWHCAMDFYNNGFISGIKSPFNFLAAQWNKFRHNNPAPLHAYYESTALGLTERRQEAKRLIEGQARVVHTIIDKAKNQTNAPLPKLPKQLTQLIAQFEITPKDLKMADSKGRVARTIENLAAGQQSVTQPVTAANFFSDHESVQIIKKHKFFHSTETRAHRAACNSYNLRILRPFPY